MVTAKEIKQRLKTGLPVEKWQLATIIEEQEKRISELETQLLYEKLQVEEAVKLAAREIQRRNK